MDRAINEIVSMFCCLTKDSGEDSALPMLRDWGEWELADSVVCCGRSDWRRDLQAGQIFYRFFCY